MQNQTRTGRITGALYLAMAVFGAVGFLALRPKLHVPLDAAQTARNLVEHATLARLQVACELGVVVTQALTAAWFFQLFRGVSVFAATSVAAFGIVNAVVVLGSAICTSTALAPANAANAQLLLDLSAKAWQFGGIFFGLWLIPMGTAARAAGFPVVLAWILRVGGVGYLASTFLAAWLNGTPSALVDLLAVPASIGEFWIIGYLLAFGWPARKAESVAPSARSAD